MIELLKSLREIDEIALLELLEITSDDIVDAFIDKIDEHQARLYKYLYEQDTEE